MNAERGQYLKTNTPARKWGTPIYALGREPKCQWSKVDGVASGRTQGRADWAPSLEAMESLLANFSLNSPALDLPRIYETLFARPLPMNAMDQQKDLEALEVGLGDKSRALYQRHYQITRFRVYRQDRLCLVDGGPQHTDLRGEEGKPERANRHETSIHACFKEAGRHPGITHR